MEELVPTADDCVLMNSFQAQYTQFQEIDLAAGTHKVALSTREGNINKMVSAHRTMGVVLHWSKISCIT